MMGRVKAGARQASVMAVLSAAGEKGMTTNEVTAALALPRRNIAKILITYCQKRLLWHIKEGVTCRYFHAATVPRRDDARKASEYVRTPGLKKAGDASAESDLAATVSVVDGVRVIHVQSVRDWRYQVDPMSSFEGAGFVAEFARLTGVGVTK